MLASTYDGSTAFLSSLGTGIPTNRSHHAPPDNKPLLQLMRILMMNRGIQEIVFTLLFSVICSWLFMYLVDCDLSISMLAAAAGQETNSGLCRRVV